VCNSRRVPFAILYSLSVGSGELSAWLAMAWSLLPQSFHDVSSGVIEVVRLRLCSRSIIIESSGDGSAHRGILGMGGVVGLCRFSIGCLGKALGEWHFSALAGVIHVYYVMPNDYLSSTRTTPNHGHRHHGRHGHCRLRQAGEEEGARSCAVRQE